MTRRRADNLREAVSKVEIAVENKHMKARTSSFGVAVYPDDEIRRALVRAADTALYRAGHSGRNRVVSAGEPL